MLLQGQQRKRNLGLWPQDSVKLLLKELKLFDNTPLRVYCDNHATIKIVNNPVYHDMTKHIEIDRHFITEKLDEGVIQVCYVRSGEQLADVLTKGVCNVTFMKLYSKMGLVDIFAPS